MDIKIMRAQDGDAEGFQRVRVDTWRNAYADIFPSTVFEEQESLFLRYVQGTPERFRRAGMYHFVAKSGGRVVGMIVATLLSKYEEFTAQGFAEIEGIYVLPKMQGLGVGERLFDIAKKTLAENGATKMVIGVLKANYKARAVYERWGGILDAYEQIFEKLGEKYGEVFYTFEI